MRRILARQGVDAAYTPAGGGGSSTVRGIFQRPYLQTEGMESSDPTFDCMASDVPGIAAGATLIIGGVTLKVKRGGIEPDPVSGIVRLQLVKGA